MILKEVSSLTQSVFFQFKNQISKLILVGILVIPTSALSEILVVPGEYVIKRAPFKAALNQTQAESTNDFGAVAQEVVKAKDALGLSLVRVNRPQARSLSVSEAAVAAEEYDAAEAAAWCEALRSMEPDIMVCEPNFVYQHSALSNDSRQAEVWGLAKIQAQNAWDLSTGSQSVTVAVIDTGIDYTHPDLAANVWNNPNEIPNNNIDDDRNGYIDDVHGINAINHSGNPYDDNGHGTHVSGTIGGVGNNSLGVSGINWNVRLMGIKFLSASGGGTLYGAIEGIRYAVASGAKIINASWGGPGYSQAMYDAIKAAEQAGVLFVAAAGNSATNTDVLPQYPSAYNLDNILAVAATGKNDAMAYFSNYGSTSVDLAAPGVSILSTIPGGDYASFSGTSMATPHVAGAAALLKAFRPELNMAQLKARLLSSGDAVADLAGKVSSGKRLNVYRAMLSTADAVEETPTPITSRTRISKIIGHRGTSKIYKQRQFSMDISGEPNTEVSVSVRFLTDKLGSVGDCTLGKATIGGDGKVTLSAFLKISKNVAPIVSEARFSAAHSSVKKHLSSLRGNNRSSTNKMTNKKAKMAVGKSCQLIQSTISSVYK